MGGAHVVVLTHACWWCAASVLRNGTVATGVVPAGGYNYYSMLTTTTQYLELTVLADRGIAWLFASYDNDNPTYGDSSWAATANDAANNIFFTPQSAGYRNATLFVSVYGKTACNYKLSAITKL
jgi:hypothetical protein